MFNNKKGVMLLFVLATIIVSSLLVAGVLNIVSSQGRFTHHKLSRIQAYYASMSGIVNAFECLREGGASCPATGATYSFTNTLFPNSIVNQRVNVAIIPVGQVGCQNPPAGTVLCVASNVDYIYN